MRIFGIVFVISLFALGIVAIRSEVNRSGRAIGKLHDEVEIKEARNQYLQLETQRLSGPQEITELAQEKLNLRRTAPQNIVVLDE